MWTMARFFPLVMGSEIPEDDVYWKNFLRLLEIMDILFVRRLPRDECGYLECLISDHHSALTELYPGVSITMKLHSMVHMPRLILEYVTIETSLRSDFHYSIGMLSNVSPNYTAPVLFC